MKNRTRTPGIHFLIFIFIATFTKGLTSILLGNNPLGDVIVGVVWLIIWIVAFIYAVISPITFEKFYGSKLKFQPTMLALSACFVLLIYYFSITIPAVIP